MKRLLINGGLFIFNHLFPNEGVFPVFKVMEGSIGKGVGSWWTKPFEYDRVTVSLGVSPSLLVSLR